MILPDISPGAYWLRVDPDQLRQLGWRDTGIREIAVPDNGDYVSGMDFVILAKEYTAFSSASQRDYRSIEGYRTAPWIIGQPDEHFTIQIMAARDETFIRQFIDKHQLNNQVAYFESRYQGEPWFSVIYGNFDSYRAAKAAAASLPASLKAAGPWVRSYNGVKALLK